LSKFLSVVRKTLRASIQESLIRVISDQNAAPDDSLKVSLVFIFAIGVFLQMAVSKMISVFFSFLAIFLGVSCASQGMIDAEFFQRLS